MEMEQRAWISIENFPPVEDEATWEGFADALMEACGDYGPVLAWEGRNVGQVVMSADVEDRAEFAERAVRCVTDALHAAGLSHLYPAAIEIEPADREPVPA